MNNEILSLSEVNTTVVPGSINCNISDLKAAVNAYAETYKVVQYSENVGEQMKQMKADRAKLNKLIEALNETRKDTKKKYLIPLDTYEQDIKELVNLVSEPCKLIDSGIKELERQRKEKKKEEITVYYQKQAVLLPEDFQDKLLPLIYRENWENISTAQKEYKAAIDSAISSYNSGIEVLKGSNSAFKEEGIEEFKKSLNLSNALALINKLQKQHDDILEKERIRLQKEAEAEIKRKEEAIRAEERKRAVEEQQKTEAERKKAAKEQQKAEAERKNLPYQYTIEEVPFCDEPVVIKHENITQHKAYIRVKDGMVVEVFSDRNLEIVVLDEDMASEKEIFEFESIIKDMNVVF